MVSTRLGTGRGDIGAKREFLPSIICVTLPMDAAALLPATKNWLISSNGRIIIPEYKWKAIRSPNVAFPSITIFPPARKRMETEI